MPRSVYFFPSTLATFHVRNSAGATARTHRVFVVSGRLARALQMGDASDVATWIRDMYPRIAGVIHPVAQLLREYADRDDVEVEFRLGRRTTGAWNSDVGFALQDGFLKRCAMDYDQATPCTLHFGQWREHADYSFGLSDGGTARTRVEYNSDTCTVKPVTVRKKLLHRVELYLVDTQYAIRVDASSELPIAEDNIPSCVRPERVAIKQRSSALHTPGGGSCPAWRYDLTIAWAAATRAEVEARQRDSRVAPEYIVELEYVGSVDDLQRFGADYMALSGLLKVADIPGLVNSPMTLASSPQFSARRADRASASR